MRQSRTSVVDLIVVVIMKGTYFARAIFGNRVCVQIPVPRRTENLIILLSFQEVPIRGHRTSFRIGRVFVVPPMSYARRFRSPLN